MWSRADSSIAAELVRLAAAQKAAGVSASIDVTRARTQLAVAEGLLIVAQSERDRARIDLARALGIDPATPIQLADTLGPSLGAFPTPVTQIIRERHGIVDKYIGDAVMAFWTPPFSAGESHAEEACLAALAQLERAARFGIDGNLIDFSKKTEVPYELLLDELLEFIDDVVDELGSRKDVEYARQILRHRTGADRQLKVFEETGDLRRVVDYIISETEHGIPLAS